MSETSEMEFDLLRRRADASNMYVQRHRKWDPAFGNGDLYLQRRINSDRRLRNHKNRDGTSDIPCIVTYATADEIHVILGRIERGELVP